MGSEGGDFDWNNGLVWSWELGKKKKDGKRKEFKKDKSIGWNDYRNEDNGDDREGI